MSKKDKFQQMKEQGGGALSSFKTLQEQVTVVAAIEQQASQVKTNEGSDGMETNPMGENPVLSKNEYAAKQTDNNPYEAHFMRLPNPQIPVREYNLVSAYCGAIINMTRQDYVELAIVEKLHNDGMMPDEEYGVRSEEIRHRPPRGKRKGTKSK